MPAGTGGPKRMHPVAEALAEGAAQVVRAVGEKAVRRAVDSVMEDGQRAVEEMQRKIAGARARVIDGDADFDLEPERVVIDVQPVDVQPIETEPQERKRTMGDRDRRRERDERNERDGSEPNEKELAQLTDLQDAETLLRHAWMLLADLSEQGVYPKKEADMLEDALEELRDRIEEREERARND